tara:strand:- start:7959 stop:8369 length:411 start_codon:yes stop_codon:yes gene_type:complete
MNSKKRMSMRFYQNLGKLFYAIAAADGKVRVEEFAQLKKLVRDQWLVVDAIDDSFDVDATDQMEVVFDTLRATDELDATTCYDEFVHYKNKKPHLFTNEVKKLIIKTASSIAHAFAGINKAELIMLARLDIELKKA